MPLTRSLALLAAFGTLANSLRSNSASVLIRTLLRCSARPNGGGIPLGSSASRTSPEWLVRCAHFAGLGFLISHASLLSRARHAVPLRLIPSFLTAHHGQPQGLPLRPHSYALNPHSYDLTPHSSLLTPQSSKNPPAPSAGPPAFLSSGGGRRVAVPLGFVWLLQSGSVPPWAASSDPVCPAQTGWGN